MGYRKGEGLGKNRQGRVNIVEASKQRGRRGLGFTIAQLDAEDVEWDFTKDEVCTAALRAGLHKSPFSTFFF